MSGVDPQREDAPTPKRPFEIDVAMARVAEAVRSFPQAALFELRDEGHGSPFEILVACILSIRTLDEVTLPVARRLFAEACTPSALLALPPGRLEELVRRCAFPEVKAARIRAIAQRLATEFGDQLPCDEALLRSLPGVGPKCANLVLGVACGIPRIAVDIHVHRVTHRWGYTSASTPEGTQRELERKLPRRFWLEINRLLVPFGKHVCTPRRPRCSTCPLLEMCPQVGVTAHR